MPLFQIDKQRLSPVPQNDFLNEKALQNLIEKNLGPVFSCRFVATEYSTGPQHGGRIDTLALSEDNNPVIIEYKKVESSELINQSLYYLAWINDHRGDFELAVQRSLGGTTVDWSDVRVICMAPSFKKYDLHAVQVMGANIELWTYRLFTNGSVYFEEVLQRSLPAPSGQHTGKNPVMVAAGKKAAEARRLGSYTFEQHLESKPPPIQALARDIQEFILKLDPAIEQVPKKLYVAFRTTQNILCLEVQKQKLLLFLKLNPSLVKGPAGLSRNVRDIGHFGTGDLEVTVRSSADLEAAKPFIAKAYQHVGA
jgi:predicted transport protein